MNQAIVKLVQALTPPALWNLFLCLREEILGPAPGLSETLELRPK